MESFGLFLLILWPFLAVLAAVIALILSIPAYLISEHIQDKKTANKELGLTIMKKRPPFFAIIFIAVIIALVIAFGNAALIALRGGKL